MSNFGQIEPPPSKESIEDLAARLYDARERARALAMMNTPTDYAARKKVFVELSVAEANVARLEIELRTAMCDPEHALFNPLTKSED